MRVATVRQDEIGLFIMFDMQKRRPGDVCGFSHAFRMDDGGLKKGDRVKVSKYCYTDKIRVKLEDGTVILWSALPDYLNPQIEKVK